MKIGKQLQVQRKIHNMSQNELADKLGISRQSISKWENGTTLPSFSNVIAIGDLFSISLDDLIRGDEELMDKFNDDKIRFSKTETIFFTGSVLFIALLIIIYSNGISVEKIDDWFPDIALISFIGLLTNIKRKEFNRSLNKKAVFFGIVLLAAIMVPFFMHGLPDFLQGLEENVKDMPYKY